MSYLTPQEIRIRIKQMPILLQWTLENMSNEHRNHFIDAFCKECEKWDNKEKHAVKLVRPNNAREVNSMMKHIGKLGN